MTVKDQTGMAKIAVFFLILLALAGGGIYYYLQYRTPDYFITFKDSKQVPEGAGVFMAGVEIGRIVSLKPSGTGVAVGIRVGRDYRQNLTEASRFFLETDETGGRLLVKNLRAGDPPLMRGETVSGTDSAFQWGAYDFARGMNDILGSGPADQPRETSPSFLEEMDRQLNQIDWDKLGRETERQMAEFSQELKGAMKEEDLRKLRQDLEKSCKEALAAVERMQNSEEARELKKALENFYRRLQAELPPEETPARKDSP